MSGELIRVLNSKCWPVQYPITHIEQARSDFIGLPLGLYMMCQLYIFLKLLILAVC